MSMTYQYNKGDVSRMNEDDNDDILHFESTNADEDNGWDSEDEIRAVSGRTTYNTTTEWQMTVGAPGGPGVNDDNKEQRNPKKEGKTQLKKGTEGPVLPARKKRNKRGTKTLTRR